MSLHVLPSGTKWKCQFVLETYYSHEERLYAALEPRLCYKDFVAIIKTSLFIRTNRTVPNGKILKIPRERAAQGAYVLVLTACA